MRRRTGLALLLGLVALTLSMCNPTTNPSVNGIPRETLAVMQATLDAQAPLAAATAQAWMTQVAPQANQPDQEGAPATVETGGIRGRLTYPDGEKMTLVVYAFNVETGEYFSVEVKDDALYRLENLPVGDYRVVAYTEERQPRAGAYTEAVACGLGEGCADHSLILVKVKANEITEGIDPADWNVPVNELPGKP